jgi:hypothetical protein
MREIAQLRTLCTDSGKAGRLIPITHHIQPTIYGNDVIDLTIFGLRSM